MSATLRCRSFAKLNLYLDVLERRPDGYHNIETIFQSVSLSDELVFTARAKGIAIDCDVKLGPPAQNLVYRAAILLQQRTGCPLGVHVELRKRIPVAAGLAGGSGNAAAALVALNQLWELRLNDQEMAALALELGSDVPYCLRGGLAAATGRGELLEVYPPLRETWFLLIHPALTIRSAAMYAHPLLQKNGSAQGGRSPGFQRAIELCTRGTMAGALFNAMERPAFADYPELERIKSRLADEAGCLGALMSGSGPTMFGVYDSAERAREAGAHLDGLRVSVARATGAGVEIV